MIRIFRVVCLVCFFPLVLVSCSGGGGSNTDPEELAIVVVKYPGISSEASYAHPVTKVTSGGSSTAKVTLSGLAGQNVFLGKVNKSNYVQSSTGRVSAYTKNGTRTEVRSARRADVRSAKDLQAGLPSRRVSGTADGFIRLEHEESRKFAENPPAIRSRSAAPAQNTGTIGPSLAEADVGDTKDFWVQNEYGNFIKKSATLRHQGSTCNIWIMDENFPGVSTQNNDNQLTLEQLTTLAAKFDGIRDRVTSVFGYERGGDSALSPGDADYGGIDGDTQIQILVYDIGFDYTSEQISGIFGYFWGKDQYSDDYVQANPYVFGNSRSNEAEMFYLDSHFTDRAPDYIYSTLVHEYQHMINFNCNVLEPASPRNVDIWYNEMLSLLSEDLFCAEMELNSHIVPSQSRIPIFLSDYSLYGLTEWAPGDEVFSSYANAYAFGAYLARNYGGAILIKELMDNGFVNAAAISKALYALNSTNGTNFPDSTITGFTTVFADYVQALVFSGDNVPASVKSFDREDIRSLGAGDDFVFSPFDIWTRTNNAAGFLNIPAGYKGPVVWELGDYELKNFCMDLQTTESWLGVSGTLEIEFVMPASQESVELYLLVR